MYDPLKHYIAEGLVVLHSYPHPEKFDRKRGRFLKVPSIEMEAAQPMGTIAPFELRVKHGNVWFNYEIDNDFFEDYTVSVKDRDDSVRLEELWKAELNILRGEIANVNI